MVGHRRGNAVVAYPPLELVFGGGCHSGVVTGGMTWKRGPTLAERRRHQLPPSTGATAAGPPRVTGPRHCWVTGLPEAPGRWPGLLVEWRTEEAGQWFGRVVYAVDDAGRGVLIETWVPARHLQPA